jgi:hypothetical protein
VVDRVAGQGRLKQTTAYHEAAKLTKRTKILSYPEFFVPLVLFVPS